MKAAVVMKYGAPEVLTFAEVPMPAMGDSDVLVRTRVIGLNFAELFARMGYYPAVPKPPFIPGIELSGVIERKGRLVNSCRIGDRVMVFTQQKAYAEYVAVPSSQVVKLPRGMGFEDAAAFGVTALTAYHGLVTLGSMKQGSHILLHAAAGGVGTAALQLAKSWGASVHATVGSDEKVDLVRSLGAVTVTNYVTEDFSECVSRATGGRGVDIVFDSVGGRIFRKGWRLLAPMGRYVTFGFAAVSGPRLVQRARAVRESLSVPLIYPLSLTSKNRGVLGFNLYFLMQETAYLRDAMKVLLDLFQKKKLRPIIGARYPFEKIIEAQRHLQSRKSVGKIVVVMGD